MQDKETTNLDGQRCDPIEAKDGTHFADPTDATASFYLPQSNFKRTGISLQLKLLCIFVINLLIIAYSGIQLEFQPTAAFIAAVAFWLPLIINPRLLDRNDLFAPRNYIFFLFFMSMVVAPPLLLSGLSGERFSKMQMHFWDYVDWTSLLWALFYLSYLVSLGSKRETSSLPTTAKASVPPHQSEPAADWMLIVGLILVGAGIIGISIAAGSVTNVIAMRGLRTAARALQDGTYRYTVWLEAAPLGACLIWYYLLRRLNLGKLGGAIWMLLLYFPIAPFYLYSSGRARTLLPLFLLLAMYHRYCAPVKLRTLLAGWLLLLPLLQVWGTYRRGIEDLEVGGEGLGVVVAGDFARFDVSVAALTGFHEASLDYLYGQTILKALLRPLTVDFGQSSLVDGTMAMGRAIFQNPEWNQASSFATPMMIEGYLNFGIVGVVLAAVVLSFVVRWLDRQYQRGTVLTTLTALTIALKLPFAVALEVSLSRLVWAVLFPLSVVWVLKNLLARPSGKGQRRSVFPHL